MDVQDNLYRYICGILLVDNTNTSHTTNRKINKAVTVLHCDYLIDSAREARAIINKKRPVSDKFALLLSIYDKRIRQHQVLMLLLNLYEVALKSKAATIISKKFSSPNGDDWFWATHPLDKHRKVKNIVNAAIAKARATVAASNTTFDLFNYLTLGDLQQIYKICWTSDFEQHFKNNNYYSNSIIQFTQHGDFDSRFERIRKYRNNIYHGNPGGVSWQNIVSDIEDILVQLQYNFHDAINKIDPNHKIIQLKYSYPQQIKAKQYSFSGFYEIMKTTASSYAKKLLAGK